MCGVLQDMYDKQMRKERGYGSDADSDGVVGFGKARPAKGIMTDEQVPAPQCMRIALSPLHLVTCQVTAMPPA